MPGFLDWVNPLSKKNPFYKFAMGTPEKKENVSTLRPEQEPLYRQSVQAGLQPGAGGAFGEAADYYRGLLGNTSEDFNRFAAPQLRQFHEDIIPNLSEQFAGMGSGGLSSSGFRNAGIQAGTDLSERLGAIRANLRHAAAQGLTNIGQIGLQNYSQNMVTQPGTQGALPGIAGAAGTAIGGPVLGAAGAAAGDAAKNWLNSWGGNKVGQQSNPYGSVSSQGQLGTFR